MKGLIGLVKIFKNNMKRLLIIILCISIFLSGCAVNDGYMNSSHGTDSTLIEDFLETGFVETAKDLQTLTYWAVFPTKGKEVILHSYKFEAEGALLGAVITAFYSNGEKNESATIPFINTCFYSYRIIDASGNILWESDGTASENGLPSMIINLAEDKYSEVLTSDDKEIKDVWFDGTYTMMSNGQTETEGSLQLKRRGVSSFVVPKKSFTIKLTEAKKLLGVKSNKDWVLVANFMDKSLLRNFFAYNLANGLNSSYTTKSAAIDLYIGNGLGTDYAGSYLLVEKIEVAKSKINISEMTEADNDTIKPITASSSDSDILAGAFLVELETMGRFTGEDAVFSIDAMHFSVKSPSKSYFEPQLNQPTKNENLFNYIKSFFVLIDEKIKSASDLSELEKYIDVDSFIDYYIINELSKNVDGILCLSTFLYKDRGGKLKISVWDFDIAFGNCNYGVDDEGNDCGVYSGFYIKKDAVWYKRLFEVPEFSEKVRKKWEVLRNGILNDSAISAVINEEANKIRSSALKNFERWAIMDMYIWPNSDEILECHTFDENVSHMISWIQKRAGWLDKNL